MFYYVKKKLKNHDCCLILVPFIGGVQKKYSYNFPALSASSSEFMSDKIDYTLDSALNKNVKRDLLYKEADILIKKKLETSERLDWKSLFDESIDILNNKYPELRDVPLKRIRPESFRTMYYQGRLDLKKVETVKNQQRRVYLDPADLPVMAGSITKNPLQDLPSSNQALRVRKTQLIYGEADIIRRNHYLVSSKTADWGRIQDDSIIIVQKKYPELKVVEYKILRPASFQKQVYIYSGTLKKIRRLQIASQTVTSGLGITQDLEEVKDISLNSINFPDGKSLIREEKIHNFPQSINKTNRVSLYELSIIHDSFLLVLKQMVIFSLGRKVAFWPPIAPFSFTFIWLEFLEAFKKFKNLPTFTEKEKLQIQKDFFSLFFTTQYFGESLVCFSNSPINTFSVNWQVTFDTHSDDTSVNSDIVGGFALLSERTAITLELTGVL